MPQSPDTWLMLASVAALWLPVGLAFLAIGAAKETQAELTAKTALLAIAAALVGYWVCGFALQFGGVAFVSEMSGLQSLTAEWSPFDLSWGLGWGMVGLRGFLLASAASSADAYLLFLSQLAPVTTAVLITLLALHKHVKPAYLLGIGLLVSGVLYPLFGNWVWGGGWLANLGTNLELGHGYVDMAGSSTIFLLAAFVAGSGYCILRPRRAAERGPARLPPVHFPLFVILGAFLSVVGWCALVLSNPLSQARIVPAMVIVNGLMAAAGGALAVSLYSWLVTGTMEALAMGRGTVAGLVAVSAACAFVPTWAALLLGAVAGLLFLLSLYAWEHILKLDDPTATAALYGVPALWGTLAVAVFSNGRWGAGWNQVGTAEFAGIPGQGVSGLWLARGFQSAGPGQLYAQLTGLAALFVLAWLLPWLTGKGLIWATKSAQRALEHKDLEPPAAEPSTESVEREAKENG